MVMFLSSGKIDRKQEDYLIFLFLMLFALVIGVCWDRFNEFGRVIFPFVWCIVATRIYLPAYLTKKYGVSFGTDINTMMSDRFRGTIIEEAEIEEEDNIIESSHENSRIEYNEENNHHEKEE